MKIKSSLASGLDVLLVISRGERHGGDIALPFCCARHFIAFAIGQAKIRDDGIKVFRLQKFQRDGDAIGHGSDMAEMAEEPGENPSGVAVVFNN